MTLAPATRAFGREKGPLDLFQFPPSRARFGELFSYDDDAASFSLENPT